MKPAAMMKKLRDLMFWHGDFRTVKNVIRTEWMSTVARKGGIYYDREGIREYFKVRHG